MPVEIYVLSSSPRLRPYTQRLKNISEATLKNVERLLPLKDIDIVLYENPDDVVAEVGGIGGYTPNAHTVLISLDPQNSKFKKMLDNSLPMTLTHEIHHAMRWRKPGYGTTLLEALITEGLGDHFSIETGTQRATPWSNALNRAQRVDLLKRAKFLFHKPYNHSDWFFGSEKKRIPRWTGYSLGYYLVGEYLKANPEATASSLVSTKASVIMHPALERIVNERGI